MTVVTGLKNMVQNCHFDEGEFYFADATDE